MPRGRRKAAVDQTLLEAALIGFEHMRRSIEEKIGDIRQRLGFGDGMKAAAPSRHARRSLSSAARGRIAAAQRKRWAATKAKAKPAQAKRTMSAAARKRIAAAQRKRWAAVKKAQATKATKEK